MFEPWNGDQSKMDVHARPALVLCASEEGRQGHGLARARRRQLLALWTQDAFWRYPQHRQGCNCRAFAAFIERRQLEDGQSCALPFGL